MFESLSGPEMAMKECRPDPEEMLKSVTDQLALVDRADSLLCEFVSIPLYMHNPDFDKAFLLIFGTLRIKRLELGKERDRWLAEIDKGDDA